MSVNGTTPASEVLAAAAMGFLTPQRRHERLALVRKHGSFAAALGEIPHSRRDIARAESMLDAIDGAGFELVCLTDSRYPRLLRAAPDPPILLTIWGRLEPDDGLALAIVGSRRATHYGLEMSRRLAASLSAAGLTIVSGLARGIDAAAHRGALDDGGRTSAVLGSGLRDVYPREHQRLARQIAERGAVISEFGLDEPPRARNFPRRNRIITGMSLGTLVVEAALKSGSLVSARIAMEQDREVYAVPGPALSANSAGVHALIRDGAKLATEASDVLEELRPEIRALLRTRRSATGRANDEALDDVERSVLEHLINRHEAVDIDSLLENLEMSVDQALAALCRLEVKEKIWSLAGGLWQARP